MAVVTFPYGMAEGVRYVYMHFPTKVTDDEYLGQLDPRGVTQLSFIEWLYGSWNGSIAHRMGEADWWWMEGGLNTRLGYLLVPSGRWHPGSYCI